MKRRLFLHSTVHPDIMAVIIAACGLFMHCLLHTVHTYVRVESTVFSLVSCLTVAIFSNYVLSAIHALWFS